jgi:hypothetical protein
MGKRVSILLAVLGTAVALVAVVPASPAEADVAYPGKELTVAPTYDGLARFTVNTIEWQDALPDYQMSVTDVATGQPVPLGYGSASQSSYSDLETDYTVPSTVPLAVGNTYQVYFHVDTVRFWHCSIYDEDGCSYLREEHYSSLWRFTYTGATLTATPYTMTTSLKIESKKKWNAHGWQILATLKADGGPLAGAKVVGEYRVGNRGRWHEDSTFIMNNRGQTKARFQGEVEPTQYRLRYEGSEIATSATSKTFSIRRRP